jgi:hypothetical protein
LGVTSTKDIEALEPVESLPEPLTGASVEGESPSTGAQAAKAASASGSENN